jgi:hypothetical protein
VENNIDARQGFLDEIGVIQIALNKTGAGWQRIVAPLV